jgi:hypothetical protein
VWQDFGIAVFSERDYFEWDILFNKRYKGKAILQQAVKAQRVVRRQGSHIF